MKYSADDIALVLLEAGAVALAPEQPFRFASGLLSPIYCDNRLLLGQVAARRTVAEALSQLALREAIGAEVVAGTATAGIPWAAWVAEALTLPMAYVRSGAKAHGRGQQVEGGVTAGQKAVLVEDLVSKGGSALDAVAGLRKLDVALADCCAIFSYGMPAAQERFGAAGVRLHCLTTLPALLEVAVRQGFLLQAQHEIVAEWAADPAAWSARRES